jgi:hypothetical protein
MARSRYELIGTTVVPLNIQLGRFGGGTLVLDNA